MAQHRKVQQQGESCFDGKRLFGHVLFELDGDMVFNIGRAFAVAMSAQRVTIGHDGTSAGAQLVAHCIDGLLSQGSDVEDVGFTTLDEMRYATVQRRAMGGLYFCADPGFVGGYEICCLGADGQRADPAADLAAIARLAKRKAFMPGLGIGTRITVGPSVRAGFMESALLAARLRPGQSFRFVINSDVQPCMAQLQLLERMGVLGDSGIEIVWTPPASDGRRGGGSVPSQDRNVELGEAVRAASADAGVLFSSTMQAPLLFDERGEPVPAEVFLALLARRALAARHLDALIFDERLGWLLESAEPSGQVESHPALPWQAALPQAMRRHRANTAFMLPASCTYANLGFLENALVPLLCLPDLCAGGQRLSHLVAAVLDGRSLRLGERVIVNNAPHALARLSAARSSGMRMAGTALLSVKNNSASGGVTLAGEGWRCLAYAVPRTAEIDLSVEVRPAVAGGADASAVMEAVVGFLAPPADASHAVPR